MFVCGSAYIQPAHSVCVASERFFIVIGPVCLFAMGGRAVTQPSDYGFKRARIRVRVRQSAAICISRECTYLLAVIIIITITIIIIIIIIITLETRYNAVLGVQ